MVGVDDKANQSEISAGSISTSKKEGVHNVF
jgi:hypothetical protein